ncbi:hypothetical protein [Roseococcus pinisoli]|uniref:Uncharacterized protein n=1 Tax=Roseococcus pinisoli TaxID=2835040 RepID=A0ABS5QD86_9PROT|nr:hypothetical protein [Roseococcus pinisoli]MBS7810558.1 hypothetical protein [Roseococcus pinisoli]
MRGEIRDPPAGALARPGAVPVGFNGASMAALLAVARSARAAGIDPAAEVRDLAWGLHPALPAALIGDAVEHVLARI